MAMWNLFDKVEKRVKGVWVKSYDLNEEKKEFVSGVMATIRDCSVKVARNMNFGKECWVYLEEIEAIFVLQCTSSVS